MYELKCKEGVIKGEKTPESRKVLDARMASLETKIDNSSNENLLQMKSPKIKSETIQPLTERVATLYRTEKTVDD